MAKLQKDWKKEPELAEFCKKQVAKNLSDPLLLRLVRAEKLLKHPDFSANRNLLQQRFAAEERRGDSLHLRERAVFAFYVENDLPLSLALAKQNWQRQKEASDTLLYAQALAASLTRLTQAELMGHQDFYSWLKKYNYEDARFPVISTTKN